MSNDCMHSCIAPNMNRCIKCGKVWDNLAGEWVTPAAPDDYVPPASPDVDTMHNPYLNDDGDINAPNSRANRWHNDLARLRQEAGRVTTYCPAVAARAHVTDMGLIAEMAERIMKNTKGSFFSASAGLIHSFAYEIANAVKRMQA